MCSEVFCTTFFTFCISHQDTYSWKMLSTAMAGLWWPCKWHGILEPHYWCYGSAMNAMIFKWHHQFSTDSIWCMSRLIQLFYQVWPFRTQPTKHDITVDPVWNLIMYRTGKLDSLQGVMHYDCAKYFPTSNQSMFLFLQGCEDSRIRLYSHKKSQWVILKKSPKFTVLKYWNKKLFLLKYFAGDR